MLFNGGRRVGSIGSLQELRLRCVCDQHTGCWHLRDSLGQPIRGGDGKPYVVRVDGYGRMTATRASWVLAGRDLPPQSDIVVARACDSGDCVRPEHLRLIRRTTLGRRVGLARERMSEAQSRALRECSQRRVVVTPELAAWLVESRQVAADAAHGLGVSRDHANQIRRERRRRLNSVWALGAQC